MAYFIKKFNRYLFFWPISEVSLVHRQLTRNSFRGTLALENGNSANSNPVGGGMEKYFIYITVGNMEEARKIGRQLLEERLAACVNLIDRMQSMYWWNDEIQEDTEVVLIAKTTGALVPAVINRVKTLHRYEIPCIVSLPVVDGNPAFLDWIEKEVTPRPR